MTHRDETITFETLRVYTFYEVKLATASAWGAQKDLEEKVCMPDNMREEGQLSWLAS